MLDVDPKEPRPERIEPTEAQLRHEGEELLFRIVLVTENGQ